MVKVTHIGNNGKPVDIGQPMPEEVLSVDFDYSKYIEDLISVLSDEEYTNLMYSESEPLEPFDNEESAIFNNYLNAIATIQTIYEDDLKTGSVSMDYNKAMKKIAQAYFDKLINFKLQKEEKFKALTAKRGELLTTLNKVVDVKRNIEDDAESRLTAFVKRKIPLGKLYIYDLNKLRNSEVYLKHKKSLNRYRRTVFSRLLDDEGIQYKPIEELNYRRKSK